MKRIIALVFLILGLVAILVPSAVAGGSKARPGGGGGVCICDPIAATQ